MLCCAVLRCAARRGGRARPRPPSLPPARPPAGLAACGAARPHAGCRQRRPAWGGLQGAVNAAGPGPASPTPPPPGLRRGVRWRLCAESPFPRGGFGSRLGLPRAPKGTAVLQGSELWRSEPAPLLSDASSVCHAFKASKQLLDAL